MVRQAYVNRLVLGRSAFDPPSGPAREVGHSTPDQITQSLQISSTAGSPSQHVQQYNLRGYPDNRESRRLSRRSRHAQNDILTTIGICVSVDEQEGGGSDSRTPKTSLEREQARVVIEEHWFGSLLGSLTEISAEASTQWVRYLRRRIQVFEAYSAASLSTNIRKDWADSSRLSFLAAGLIPDICYHGVKGILEGIWEAFQEDFGPSVRSLIYDHSPFNPGSLLAAGGFLWRLSARWTRVSLGILLDNLIMLQKLQLVESWPPISRDSLSTVLSLAPSAPKVWSLTSTIGFSRSWLTSPFVLCFVYRLIDESLREKLFAYMQTIMIRPDNPDSSSFKLELDDDQVDAAEATVLRLPFNQRTFTEQVAMDYRVARESIMDMVFRAREAASNRFSQLSMQISTHSSAQPLWHQRTVNRPSTFRARVHDVIIAPAVSFATDNQTIPGPDSSDSGEHEPIQRRNPPSPDPNITPPQSPTGSSDEAASNSDPNAVQVRTRSGSTSTLHMDLEVHLPANSQGVQERRHNSFTTSEQTSTPVRRVREPSLDHHRVTQLTVHSSTTLSVQMALVISSAVLVPLESVYLRSVARSFLAARGMSSPQINSLVYPATRLGLRGHDWKGIVAYSGQLMLCFGLETVIRLYFWRICGSVSLWWGRNKFGWGRL